MRQSVVRALLALFVAVLLVSQAHAVSEGALNLRDLQQFKSDLQRRFKAESSSQEVFLGLSKKGGEEEPAKGKGAEEEVKEETKIVKEMKKEEKVEKEEKVAEIAKDALEALRVVDKVRSKEEGSCAHHHHSCCCSCCHHHKSHCHKKKNPLIGGGSVAKEAANTVAESATKGETPDGKAIVDEAPKTEEEVAAKKTTNELVKEAKTEADFAELEKRVQAEEARAKRMQEQAAQAEVKADNEETKLHNTQASLDAEEIKKQEAEIARLRQVAAEENKVAAELEKVAQEQKATAEQEKAAGVTAADLENAAKNNANANAMQQNADSIKAQANAAAQQAQNLQQQAAGQQAPVNQGAGQQVNQQTQPNNQQAQPNNQGASADTQQSSSGPVKVTSGKVRGKWIPPSDVLAASQAMGRIKYDDSGPWTGRGGCKEKQMMQGTRALKEFLLKKFPDSIRSIGGYSCRQNTANKAKISVHGTGRALDIMIPTIGGDADNGKGDPVANYLVKHAKEIGMQYLIWDRYKWSGSRSSNKFGDYGGPNPHVDHLHVELNLAAGAQGPQPWWKDE